MPTESLAAVYAFFLSSGILVLKRKAIIVSKVDIGAERSIELKVGIRVKLVSEFERLERQRRMIQSPRGVYRQDLFRRW